MNIWTVIIFVFLLNYIGFARSLFRYRINAPVVIGLSWAPALYLSSLGVEFTSSTYQHLSNQNLSLSYIIIFITFISIFIGYAFGCRNKLLYNENVVVSASSSMLHVLFFAVFGLKVHIILQSNVLLTFYTLMSPEDVRDLRESLHVGAINHLTLGLNFLAANYFVLFMQSKKKAYLIPVLLVFFAHAATLQKSPVMGFILQMFFVNILYTGHTLNKNGLKVLRWLAVSVLGLVLVTLFLKSNEIRGIGLQQKTNLDPINEQLFIYLGGPAILNLSATLTDRLPSVDLYGLLVFQSFAWLSDFRDLFHVTKYFGGINNGTVIVYWWADMSLFGILLHGMILGLIVGKLQLVAKNNMLLLYLCAMSYQFLAMSIFTEFLYQPTTALIVINIFVLQVLLKLRLRIVQKRQLSR